MGDGAPEGSSWVLRDMFRARGGSAGGESLEIDASWDKGCWNGDCRRVLRWAY